MMPRSLMAVDHGGSMLLLDGWVYGASTNNPNVIAIPVRNGSLIPEQIRVFEDASVIVSDRVARVRQQRGPAGTVWKWAGGAWEVDKPMPSF